MLLDTSVTYLPAAQVSSECTNQRYVIARLGPFGVLFYRKRKTIAVKFWLREHEVDMVSLLSLMVQEESAFGLRPMCVASLLMVKTFQSVLLELK